MLRQGVGRAYGVSFGVRKLALYGLMISSLFMQQC